MSTNAKKKDAKPEAKGKDTKAAEPVEGELPVTCGMCAARIMAD